MNPGKHLYYLIQQWPFDPECVCVRLVKGVMVEMSSS